MSEVRGLGWRMVLYNFLLHTLSLLLLPWVLAQLLIVPRRRVGVGQRLGAAPKGGGSTIWIHAVSVGEVRAVSPMVQVLLEKLKGRSRLVLSTVTVTGQRTAAQVCGDSDEIFYFPLDLFLPVRRSLNRVRPEVFVTTETEIWPNFFYCCFARDIPVVLVNGRISDRSFARYRAFRWFFRPFLQTVTLFLMQSEEDAGRIRDLGAPPERVNVTGNMKFDMKPKPAKVPESVRRWGSESFLLVSGSTHRGEEDILLDALGSEALREVRMALVPRHPERFEEVADLLKRRGCPFTRYSVSGDRVRIDTRVVLVDAMGVLEGFYAMADIAFVGGSLVPVGGHNLLEPAMYGVPVLTGPHVNNFKDITDALVKAGGCVIVKDPESITEAVRNFIETSELREEMGRAALTAFDNASGASARNIDLLLEVMKRTSGSLNESGYRSPRASR